MPSERRLHPLSFVFDIVGQVRQFVVPGLVVLVGAGSAGLDWQGWLTLLVIPYAIVALVRSMTFRYRFDPDELVMTSGLIFRNERHVPYGRIQNIDAVQNVLHRLLRVVEVRVETGGGDEPEARMRVLPLPALEEMRERVLAGRTGRAGPQAAGTAAAVEQPRPERRTLLALGLRELLLAGFIDSKGLIIVGAAFGLLWEVGLFDPTINFVFGENATGRGVTRQVGRALLGGGMPSIGRIAILTLGFAAFVLVIRLLSMGWSLIRLWGFRLNRLSDDLGTEFGLFTRVMATIPLRRIQTLTVRQSLLHRVFKTAAIRVDSAEGTGGGEGGQGRGARRESLAPIVNVADVPRLLAEVLPDVDVAGVTWRPVDPLRFPARLQGIARSGDPVDPAFHPHAPLVDARVARGARHLGVGPCDAVREAPRVGRRRLRGPLSQRILVARGHRGALQQDSGRDRGRVSLRSPRPYGQRARRYRRRRRRATPRSDPVPRASDCGRSLSPARR